MNDIVRTHTIPQIQFNSPFCYNMEKDNTNTPKEPTIPPNNALPVLSVEDMIEQSIGQLNRYQISQAILVSLLSLFDSLQTFISIIAESQPSWHCSNTRTTSCTQNSNLCSLSRTEWGWNSGNVHTSIISEWDLECVSSFIAGLPTTCFFIGCVLGGFVLAALGDSTLGRKNLLCFSSFLMNLTAFGCAFAPNIWVYSVLRFLSGIGRAPIVSCVLILLTERVGKQWRTQMATGAFAPFAIGILTLTGSAFGTRHLSWRILYLITSIPGIIYTLLCYIFVLDSPRWLFMRGRNSDAMAVLQSLGSKIELIHCLPNRNTVSCKISDTNPFISLKILISKRWALIRLSASIIIIFGIGMTYFGMLLGVGNLGFNIYLTTMLNALFALASSFLTFFYWIPRFNRRSSVMGLCIISGAASVIFSVTGKGNEAVIIVLDLASLFTGCMAYNIMMKYVVELFPTCVRNCATSLVRQASVLGSVFVPIMVLKGGKNLVLSYGVFGCVLLVGGFLVLCLPETRGNPLCDTMEEQEFSEKISDP